MCPHPNTVLTEAGPDDIQSQLGYLKHTKKNNNRIGTFTLNHFFVFILSI